MKKLIPVFVSLALLGFLFYFTDLKLIKKAFEEFGYEVIIIVLVLLIFNLLIVSVRLWRCLIRLGCDVKLNTAFKASFSGHFASIFIFSLLGQTLGRQSILANLGISPSIVSIITMIERITLAAISLSLAIVGVFYIYGNRMLSFHIERMPFFEIGLVIVVVSGIYIFIGRGQTEYGIISFLRLRKIGAYIFEVGGLTLIAYSFMLMAFSTAIWAIDSNIPLLKIFFASAVISFVASMPISVNGWGVREAASVYVLRYFDIPMENALAISILIGICATATVIFMTPYVFRKNKKTKLETQSIKNNIFTSQILEKPVIWVLSAVVINLIIFQVHTNIPELNAVVNINLADPFIFFVLAIIIQYMFVQKTLPRWREPNFNVFLIIISAMLLIGFVRALPEIGVTNWALMSRLFGWLILLGYMFTGYLAATYFGQQGIRRFADNLTLIVVVVVFLQIIIRWMHYFGVNLGIEITPHFEGYAGNRNAFSIQLLVCISIIVSYLVVLERGASTSFLSNSISSKKTYVLSILVGGMLLAGSRAGLGTMAIMFIYLAMAGKVKTLTLVKTVAYGVLFYFFVNYFPFVVKFVYVYIATGEFLGFQSAGLGTKIALASQVSDSERWLTIIHGFEMWLQHPLFGSGLGVFIETSTEWSTRPIVIHSTPLWILAEFGLFGGIVFGWVFLKLMTFVFKQPSNLPVRNILLLMLLVFIIFSSVHEIFYQRIFWLMLGMVMAKPGLRMVQMNDPLGRFGKITGNIK